jgi:DNA/RNA-binding domain of Phe-tRNA-synthetase-like protein
MRYSIDMGIFGVLPDYLRVVIVARGIDNTQNLVASRNLLSKAIDAAATRFGAQPAGQHHHLSAWRRAYAAFGLEAPLAHTSDSSIPDLLKLGQPATPLANLAQAIGIQHAVPGGAHDLAAVAGNLWLRPARATELFIPVTTPEQPVAPDIGEIIYVDDGPHVLRRQWHGATSAGTRVTPATRDAIIYFDCLPPVGLVEAEEFATQTARLIAGFLDADSQTHILTWQQPSATIVY